MYRVRTKSLATRKAERDMMYPGAFGRVRATYE
jgi:hypothetical protein